LTYHVGCTADGEIYLRIYANTAAGFFSQEWLPLTSINQVLSKAGGHFTSFALQSLFRGKSQNNPAFLLAVLQREGLVGRATDKKRCYDKLDAGPFIAEIKAYLLEAFAEKTGMKYGSPDNLNVEKMALELFGRALTEKVKTRKNHDVNTINKRIKLAKPIKAHLNKEVK
jgi:hypothetical protein